MKANWIIKSSRLKETLFIIIRLKVKELLEVY